MEDILGEEDSAMLAEEIKQVSPLTDRLVTISRVSGFTGGDYAGGSPVPVVPQEFIVPGTIESVTQEEVVRSGGLLSLGNLRLETVLEINQKNETIPTEGDVLKYEGQDWYTVGIPNREYLAGGLLYTKSFWKRT